MSSIIYDDDVVIRKHNGKPQLALVLRNYDLESDTESDSDLNSDEFSDASLSDAGENNGSDTPGLKGSNKSSTGSTKNKKGRLLVCWYPKGKTQIVPSDKVHLLDRSLLAGDLIERTQTSSGKRQLGTVHAAHIDCHLQVVGAKQMIYNISSENLKPVKPYSIGTFVLLDSWIGEVSDISTEMVVRLKNGSRCILSEMAAERLTDVRDHTPEDSAFGINDGFYPNQVLRGKATFFKNARWLDGQQPVITSKAFFRVVVEEVRVESLKVDWQTRGLSGESQSDMKPPPRKVGQKVINRVRPLKFFSSDSFQLGDKAIYTIQDVDDFTSHPVTIGSSACFFKPTQNSPFNFSDKKSTKVDVCSEENGKDDSVIKNEEEGTNSVPELSKEQDMDVAVSTLGKSYEIEMSGSSDTHARDLSEVIEQETVKGPTQSVLEKRHLKCVQGIKGMLVGMSDAMLEMGDNYQALFDFDPEMVSNKPLFADGMNAVIKELKIKHEKTELIVNGVELLVKWREELYQVKVANSTCKHTLDGQVGQDSQVPVKNENANSKESKDDVNEDNLDSSDEWDSASSDGSTASLGKKKKVPTATLR